MKNSTKITKSGRIFKTTLLDCESCEKEYEVVYLNKKKHDLCKKCYSKKWTKENYKLSLEASSRWKRKHKEQVNKINKKYRDHNIDKFKKIRLSNRKRNKEKIDEITKISKLKKPLKYKLLSKMGKAKRRSYGNEFNIKESDLLKKYNFQDGACVYCGSDLGINFHLDHIQPISRNGDNSLKNLQLLCPTCNLSKNNKTDEEYRKYISFMNC